MDCLLKQNKIPKIFFEVWQSLQKRLDTVPSQIFLSQPFLFFFFSDFFLDLFNSKYHWNIIYGTYEYN